MAIAICPTLSVRESPIGTHGNEDSDTRSTARSVCGSSPTRSARKREPSERRTSHRLAPLTTWLLVSTKPSGAKMTPEPPCRSCSTRTTEGPTMSMAPVTAVE